jgi:hypothetical protein
MQTASRQCCGTQVAWLVGRLTLVRAVIPLQKNFVNSVMHIGMISKAADYSTMFKEGKLTDLLPHSKVENCGSLAG